MSAPFETGLIVGKFAPLHDGHVMLIEEARRRCRHLILISYSNPEMPGSAPQRRAQWLADCFPECTRLVVTDARLDEWLGTGCARVPPNEAPDEVHRDFVAMLCLAVLGRGVDAVFTSEAYGEGFAAHLTRRFRARQPGMRDVAHVLLDPQRRRVPISATLLREDAWRHWDHLPPPVARTLVRRVALLGGESSGKTALAQALARSLGTVWVPEYGRELWEARGGALEPGDMARIAREQIRREEGAGGRARLYIFCDTSPLTTLFYAREMFGRAEPELVQAAGRAYDEVVLCAPDFEFVQDGTRRDAAFRARQHAWYEAELAARGVRYRLARGSLERRVAELRRALPRGIT